MLCEVAPATDLEGRMGKETRWVTLSSFLALLTHPTKLTLFFSVCEASRLTIPPYKI